MQKTRKPFIIPIFIPHAGCPHRCIFCDQAAITSEAHASLTPGVLRQKVNAHLKFKSKDRKPVQLAFYGGNFLGQKPQTISDLLSEASRFVQAGQVDSIRFSTRPDTVDTKRLFLIEKFPVGTIELGVQSMDDKVLEQARRGHSAADTEAAVGRLKENGYEIGLQMMIGLPGDSRKGALASARRMAALTPDFVRIYPTVVLAGSPLARWYEKGAYAPLNLEEAVSLTRTLYLLFTEKNIAVVRMGLQASEDLDDGAQVLAGPYHPAFGHLVYGEIFLDRARAMLQASVNIADTVTLRVHPRSRSRLQGLRNRNIQTLKSEFNVKSIRIQSDDSLGEDELQMV